VLTGPSSDDHDIGGGVLEYATGRSALSRDASRRCDNTKKEDIPLNRICSMDFTVIGSCVLLCGQLLEERTGIRMASRVAAT
jgi:hypothetical protein